MVQDAAPAFLSQARTTPGNVVDGAVLPELTQPRPRGQDSLGLGISQPKVAYQKAKNSIYRLFLETYQEQQKLKLFKSYL